MAKVFIFRGFSGTGRVWNAKNGATRRELVFIVNEKDFPEDIEVPEDHPVIGKVGFLDKGNHSFVFLNKSEKDDTVIGIFKNADEGDIIFPKDKVIFQAESHGGYGGRWSTLAVVKEGAFVEVTTYKNRRPSTYYRLTPNGWKCLGTKADIIAKAPVDSDAMDLATELGLFEEAQVVE